MGVEWGNRGLSGAKLLKRKEQLAGRSCQIAGVRLMVPDAEFRSAGRVKDPSPHQAGRLLGDQIQYAPAEVHDIHFARGVLAK
jgi:hypothetical protein